MKKLKTKNSKLIKTEFKKFPEVEIVILFGSAAKNQLIRQSDIDIAFAQKRITSHEKQTEIYMALEKSLRRDIDLVDLHKVNGHILKKILCEGDTLIKGSIPLMAFFFKKMWYNQADMMPKTKMILEKQVNGFING